MVITLEFHLVVKTIELRERRCRIPNLSGGAPLLYMCLCYLYMCYLYQIDRNFLVQKHFSLPNKNYNAEIILYGGPLVSFPQFFPYFCLRNFFFLFTRLFFSFTQLFFVCLRSFFSPDLLFN